MNHRVVTVQFSRDGEREGLNLDPQTVYQARIDGGPPCRFSSPWKQEELEDLVEILRNKGDQRPTTELLRELGRKLGDAIHEIEGMEAALARRGDEFVTVYWQLDYPELARIPWELATRNQPPHHHLLDEDISFVRKVPAAHHDAPAQWPTGRKESLRLGFFWGERSADDVPHKEHLAGLQEICEKYGVDLVFDEVPNVEALTGLCTRKEPFHFVHILAHGGKAANGEWGLSFKNEVAKPEQVARALRAGGTTPALVTVSACDSANEKDQSFGSVAYQLHMYGVPLVVASQFRLRKSASNVSAAMVYEELLRGGDLRSMLKAVRRRLAPGDNEAWANEVVYTRYRYESLDELANTARRQGVLRRANQIRKLAEREEDPARKAGYIDQLDEESDRLNELIDELRAKRASPSALAETYGLIGSLQRRKALLRKDPPDEEDLRDALACYEDGMRADANSHFCGINVVHLSLRVGEREKADEFIPLVRFAAENQFETDFWAYATAGELEVYAGNRRKAADRYREFARAAARHLQDKGAVVVRLESSRRQLGKVLAVFADDESIKSAAEAALKALDAAIERNT